MTKTERKNLENELLKNFENDEITDIERLVNILQIIDKFRKRDRELIEMYREKIFRFTNCKHEYIHNLHQKTKYCRKGCDGYKEHNTKTINNDLIGS